MNKACWALILMATACGGPSLPVSTENTQRGSTPLVSLPGDARGEEPEYASGQDSLLPRPDIHQGRTAKCYLDTTSFLGFVFSDGNSPLLYHNDSSPWRTIPVGENIEAKDAAFLKSPFEYIPQYGVVVLRCLAIEQDYYKVLIDETKNLTALVRRKDPNIHFDYWQSHMIGVSIEPDTAETPWRVAPSDTAWIQPLHRDVGIITAESINGDWLKVNISSEEKPRYLWVRWRKGRCVLIAWGYTC